MKKNTNRILSLALALYMVMYACGFTAYAIEPDTILSAEIAASSSGNVYKYPSITSGLAINSTQWKTVAYSTTGFNCNVYIQCMNSYVLASGIAKTSIRMLDKNDNVIWSEDGAIAGQGYRIFVCGSDVYTIQLKTQAGTGSACAYETTADPT